MAGTSKGAMISAAGRLGMAPDDYLAHVAADEKWCVGCKAWHPIDAFGQDVTRLDGRATICPAFRSRRAKTKYVPKLSPGPFGPAPAPSRGGDKVQARQRVNVLVRTGRLPHPRMVPCADCRHLGADRRHEYDHHEGYAADKHLSVQVVCARCHRARERSRGVRIGRCGVDRPERREFPGPTA